MGLGASPLYTNSAARMMSVSYYFIYQSVLHFSLERTDVLLLSQDSEHGGQTVLTVYS